MKYERPTNICCVCGRKFKGWGNDPWPLDIIKDETDILKAADKSEPVCCDECNMDHVLPARLKLLETSLC